MPRHHAGQLRAAVVAASLGLASGPGFAGAAVAADDQGLWGVYDQ